MDKSILIPILLCGSVIMLIVCGYLLYRENAKEKRELISGTKQRKQTLDEMIKEMERKRLQQDREESERYWRELEETQRKARYWHDLDFWEKRWPLRMEIIANFALEQNDGSLAWRELLHVSDNKWPETRLKRMLKHWDGKTIELWDGNQYRIEPPTTLPPPEGRLPRRLIRVDNPLG